MTQADPYRPQLRRRRKPTTVLVASLAAALVTALVLWWAVGVASRNPEVANLGSEVFRFDAEDLADEISDRGPFLLQDPLNRGRELYVQHLGSSPKRGWQAISAYGSSSDFECLLTWSATQEQFVDPCSKKTFPADGRGLKRYPVEVVDGKVEIDLRSAGSRTGP